MRIALTCLCVTLVCVLSVPAAFASSYTDVVDITFPTVADKVEYIDSYDAPRSGGRVHKATDIMGEKMLEEYAAVGGEITWIPGADGEGQPSYGYMITIAGDDGREYSYIHLNNDTPGTDDGKGGPEHAYAEGLQEGSRVERGQFIGWMGDSGNAEGTAPHLHFEIVDPDVNDPYGTHRMNPYFSLEDAKERGDVVGGEGQGDDSTDESETPAASEPPAESESPAASEPPEESESPAASEPPSDAPSDPPDEADEPETGHEPVALLDDPAVTRHAGEDRVSTTAALSAASFQAAEDVVLAPAYTFADAIVAGPLAAALDAPVLTTDGAVLDDRVVTEMERLGAKRVTMIGGTGVLSQAVEDALDDDGYEVERLWGDGAEDTAAVVAERVWDVNGTPAGQRRALVALGQHQDPTRAWPDALGAGWYGAVSGEPVLLVSQESVGASTLEVLDGVTQVTIAGGEAAVPKAVADEIAEQGAMVRRLFGADRFGTSVALADDIAGRLGNGGDANLWVATGWEYADAIAAAPSVARLGGTLALVDGSGNAGDGELEPLVDRLAGAVEALDVLGGTAAVQDEAVLDVQERLQD